MVFEVIYPKSHNNAAYAVYEYMLCWYGRDGGWYQYLFYDAEIKEDVDNGVINAEDPEYFSSIVKDHERTVRLVAEDLTLNDIDVMAQLMSNKQIIRLYKNGTSERIVPVMGSYKRNETDGRYNISFRIRLKNRRVWR